MWCPHKPEHVQVGSNDDKIMPYLEENKVFVNTGFFIGIQPKCCTTKHKVQINSNMV